MLSEGVLQDLCVFEGKCHVIINVVVDDIW